MKKVYIIPDENLKELGDKVLLPGSQHVRVTAISFHYSIPHWSYCSREDWHQMMFGAGPSPPNSHEDWANENGDVVISFLAESEASSGKMKRRYRGILIEITAMKNENPRVIGSFPETADVTVGYTWEWSTDEDSGDGEVDAYRGWRGAFEDAKESIDESLADSG